MKILRYISAYTFWVILFVLGILIFVLARTVFLAYLGVNISGESYIQRTQGRLFDQVFTVLLGISWFIYVIVTEEYLRKSVKRGGMLKQFVRYLGIELLILVVFHGLLLYFQGGAGIGWLTYLSLALELVGGAICIYLGWSKRSPLPGKTIKAYS